MLVYLVDLLTIRAHFDRYVLPLVPPLAVLAGRQRTLAPLTLGLLIVPLVWAIGDDVRLTRTDTRVVAHAGSSRTSRATRRSPPSPRRRRSTATGSSASRCPARAGRSTPTATSPGSAREGVRYALVTGRGRRPRARRPRPLPAGGALLRRTASPREAGLPCSSRARADRALGLRLPAMRKTLLLIPLLALAARRLRRRLLRDSEPRPEGARAACPRPGRRAGRSSRTRSTPPVYCPSWLPDPLTGQIGGTWNNIDSVVEGPQLPDRLRLAGAAARRSTSTCAAIPVVTKIPTCRYDRARRRQEARHEACRASPTRAARRRSAASRRRCTRSTRTPTSGTSSTPGTTTATLYTLSEHVAPPLHLPEGRREPEPDDARARPRAARVLTMR